MAAALVILFFGGIFLAIFMIICVVGVSMFIAPFAGGALASVMVCETVPGAKGLVPGHTFLNYLVVLFIVETIILSQLKTYLHLSGIPLISGIPCQKR